MTTRPLTPRGTGWPDYQQRGQRIGSLGHLARLGTVTRIGTVGQVTRMGSVGRIGTLGYITRIGTVGVHGTIHGGRFGTVARVGTVGQVTRVGSQGYLTRVGTAGVHGSLGRVNLIGSARIFAGSLGRVNLVGSAGIRGGSLGRVNLIGSARIFAGSMGRINLVGTAGVHGTVHLIGSMRVTAGSLGRVAYVGRTGTVGERAFGGTTLWDRRHTAVGSTYVGSWQFIAPFDVKTISVLSTLAGSAFLIVGATGTGPTRQTGTLSKTDLGAGTFASLSFTEQYQYVRPIIRTGSVGSGKGSLSVTVGKRA